MFLHDKHFDGFAAIQHDWLMKGRMRVWKPPLPGHLLHKCVEEREKTPEVSLHEPPWQFRQWGRASSSLVGAAIFGRLEHHPGFFTFSSFFNK